jgi:4-hydroxy-3-methylbut-2-enyl diphosphate reductase
LCERKFPTYFISSAREIESNNLIHHYDYPNKKRIQTSGFLPLKTSVKIIITSGASCPDSALEEVIHRINDFFTGILSTEEVLKHLQPSQSL